jgi:hypothetical protein
MQCAHKIHGRIACTAPVVITRGGVGYCRYHAPYEDRTRFAPTPPPAKVDCPKPLRDAVLKIVRDRTVQKCAGTKKDGGKCGQIARRGSLFCGYHGADPTSAARSIQGEDSAIVVEDLLAALVPLVGEK